MHHQPAMVTQAIRFMSGTLNCLQRFPSTPWRSIARNKLWMRRVVARMAVGKNIPGNQKSQMSLEISVPSGS
eukprot:12410960-Karenia_brevis.AAC.1